MRVLVAGDAMVDRYWHGDVGRVSPEAPVPVVQIQREEYSAGGAKNVAKNIEAMGVEVSELYSRSYRENPVLKVRVIARGQQVCRLDWDHPQAPIDPGEFAERLQDCDLVVLSDYGKGALENISALIWQCRRANKRVIVDPKAPPASRYDRADVLKPNVGELRAMIGPWASEEDLEHKVKAMQRHYKIPTVLLTRGPEGMTLYNGAVKQIACEAKEVFDVTGAGDTAVAAFAAAIAKGATDEHAARLANRAAGVAVGRQGTAVVRWEDFA